MKKKYLYPLLITLITIALVGCNTKPTNPRENAGNFLDAVKQQDFSKAEQFYEETFENIPLLKNKVEAVSPAVAKELFNKLSDFDYDIERVEEDSKDSNQAIVWVKITYYNLGSAFESVIKDFLAEDIQMSFSGANKDETIKKAEEIILVKLGGAKKETAESIPIRMTKEENKWIVQSLTDNKELLNALSGNIISSLPNIDLEP